MKKSLETIENGKKVTVTAIGESALRVKLLEMGFTEGKQINVLFRAPLGDPIAVDVDGYVLSLRKDEARLIEVEPVQMVEV